MHLRRLATALVATTTLTTLLACTPQATAQPDPGPYLGRWNYDLPDRAAMTNIATLNTAGGALGPQIGDIVFTSPEPGRVTGRTDVGCTWQFRVTSDALVLDPPNQLCHNPTSNYSYTTTAWTVRVAEGRETESITAISHHADADYEFVLDRGARSRVEEYDPGSSALFTGTWDYGAPDPSYGGANTRLTFGADGKPAVRPESGSIVLSRDFGNRVTARTADGCHWTLVTRGNTAKLDPPVQTCTVRDQAVTLRYFTIAAAGGDQVAQSIGTDADGARFTVTGLLTKR
ncbi:hypothetical protein [Nocardia sp. NPDC051832]|uniref:hypothetical protein n=1 Tax=Nocardia sp. NPDC051832 TaxID=3155673 RepID=UPI00341DA78E